MDLIVCSLEDVASTTLRDALLDRADLEPADDGVWRGDGTVLWTIDDLHLDHDDVDVEVEQALDVTVDRTIVLSRHQSEAGVPSLTVHPIGNFGDAPYGGREATLVPAPTSFLAPMLGEIADRAPDGYDPTLEATHHGPYLETPTCFVEIGSDEQAWKDRDAADAMVDALLSARDAEPTGPTIVGLGGGHYQPRLTDLALSYDIRLGHMLPDWAFSGVPSIETVEMMAEATPGAEAAYLDRRSFGDEAERVEEVVERAGLEVVRSDDLPAL